MTEITLGKTFKDIVSSSIPLLGGLLGGPLGTQAGKIISQLLTGKDYSSEQEMQDKINNLSTDELLKLKQLDNEMSVKLVQAELDKSKLEYDDLANARQTYIDAIRVSDNDTGFQAIINRPPVILAYLLTLLLASFTLLFMFLPIQPGAKDIMELLIGSFATCWIQAMSLFLGKIQKPVAPIVTNIQPLSKKDSST